MKLQDMKRIAEARTPGEWLEFEGELVSMVTIHKPVIANIYKPENIEFIAMAANKMDALIKVAEAAKDLNSNSHSPKVWLAFQEALDALEK